MERYSCITQKRKREIVLLRGSGCVYRKCAFCDYHLDKCDNESENFSLNRKVLSCVTGEFGELEVINSGSVFELDKNTLEYIKSVCTDKKIHTVHFESHYLYKDKIAALRAEFCYFCVKMKLGLETFDFHLRENMLKKGIPEHSPAAIAKDFDEANFLFGISGQTAESMAKDVKLGLEFFERICVNIMCENSTPVKPDGEVIKEFIQKIYPQCVNDERIDVLINNTDFGVGD